MANRGWVEEQITNFGAVLIRGFQINDAPEFERAIKSLQPNLSDAYRGTSPRSVFDGTKYTFSAADAPNSYPIAQHCEMSFLKSPPRQLYFGCLQESKSGGGETALCDFRAVANEFDAFSVTSLQRRNLIIDKRIINSERNGQPTLDRCFPGHKCLEHQVRVRSKKSAEMKVLLTEV